MTDLRLLLAITIPSLFILASIIFDQMRFGRIDSQMSRIERRLHPLNPSPNRR